MNLEQLFMLFIVTPVGVVLLVAIVVYCIARVVSMICTKFIPDRICSVCEMMPAEVSVGDEYYCYTCHFMTHVFDNDVEAKHLDD